MHTAERSRNCDDEGIERNRYRFLEQVYLIAGPDCRKGVTLADLAVQMDITAESNESLIADLIRLGYLDRTTEGEICLTEKAVDYLQHDAWRRRTIRE